jgi:predicted double-glycine peptidase
MDFKQIQELIRMVNDSNIGEVSIEQKDFKITVRQKEEQIAQVMSSSLPAAQITNTLSNNISYSNLPHRLYRLRTAGKIQR